MKLVTVATFDSAIEADLAMTVLESDGIQAWVHDDAVARVNPVYGVLVGGVKLRVDEADVERAYEVLTAGLEDPNAPLEFEDPAHQRMFEQAADADRAEAPGRERGRRRGRPPVFNRPSNSPANSVSRSLSRGGEGPGVEPDSGAAAPRDSSADRFSADFRPPVATSPGRIPLLAIALGLLGWLLFG